MLSLKSKITQSVLLYFFINTHARVYVNELARILELDNGNLSRKLIEIESVGILQSDWQGDQRYYSLNNSFPLLSEYQKIILQTVGLHKMLQSSLKKVEGINRAFIFGSYVANKLDKNSDIDFMVIGNCDEITVQKAIAKIEKMIKRDINTIIVDKDEFNKKVKSDPFLKNINKAERIEVIK